MEALKSTNEDARPLSDLNIIRDFYVVSLVDNFDHSYLERLEMRLLTLLCNRHEIKGVIFSCNEVETTDYHDLLRFRDMLKSVKLIGARIGLCCINPGLASVMVTTNLNFEKEIIGSDIDDLLDSL